MVQREVRGEICSGTVVLMGNMLCNSEVHTLAFNMMKERGRCFFSHEPFKE